MNEEDTRISEEDARIIKRSVSTEGILSVLKGQVKAGDTKESLKTVVRAIESLDMRLKCLEQPNLFK